MNPFTRFLSQWSSDQSFDAFIVHWDSLERVVIGVHRQKMSLQEATPLFDETWAWLRQNYPKWAKQLRPYWQQTQTAGQPTQQDPFQLLIDLPTADAILNNWSAMQHLPAAREALNQYLLDQNP